MRSHGRGEGEAQLWFTARGRWRALNGLLRVWQDPRGAGTPRYAAPCSGWYDMTRHVRERPPQGSLGCGRYGRQHESNMWRSAGPASKGRGGSSRRLSPYYAVVNPETLDDVVRPLLQRSSRRGSLDFRSCMQIAPCLNKYSPFLLVCGRTCSGRNATPLRCWRASKRSCRRVSIAETARYAVCKSWHIRTRASKIRGRGAWRLR
jgi:hypothetical protein